MKERWSDKNRYLSTGALTYSGNSKPIPELRVGIPDYVRIPILGSWFSIKGHLGYGRLTDDSWRRENGGGTYAQGVLFHSKSLFVRFGDEERFPLLVTLGLEMNNLFGGVRYWGENERQMPSDAAAYWTALFPFHHIEQQGNDDGEDTRNAADQSALIAVPGAQGDDNDENNVNYNFHMYLSFLFSDPISILIS